MNRMIGHVVVQTHWDREWYFTREQYLARLIRAASHFVAELDAGRLDSFLFDGQTIAAEDLLGACEPNLALRLRALMAEGRIVLGPWYVSADEFLVDGECLVRNLERGMATARRLGNCQHVGYVPDTFGHIAQLPQILRGFDIDNAVLWRGSDHSSSEFEWFGPDGSGVFTVLLTQGYYQHPFNARDWRAATTAYFQRVEAAASTRHLLLTQGGDHLLTVEDMRGRVDAYNAGDHDFALRISRLETYIAGLKEAASNLETFSGELRNNGRAFVLPDTLSTRRYLKVANQRIEDRLIGLVEPLLAVTPFVHTPYPARYLSQTWDMLLQQQPHDSICGCSIDPVHDEMLIRFAALDDRLDALVALAGRVNGMINDRAGLDVGTGPFADDACCTLFNPSPKLFEGWIEAEIFLKGGRYGSLSAARADGQPVDAVIIGSEPHRAFSSPLDDFPDHVAGHRYHVAIRTRLEGLQMAAMDLEGSEAASATPLGDSIGNERFEVRCGDDGVVLSDLASGRDHHGLFRIESSLDAGDSYNYSPPPSPSTSCGTITAWRATKQGPGCETLTLDLELDQPAALNDDRSGRSDGRVTSHGRLTLMLLAGEPMVRASISWDNEARDHRLRLVSDLREAVGVTSSDGGFAWTTRPVTIAQVPDAPSCREAPVSVNPSHSVIAVGAFGFVHRGLQEFEVERRAQGDVIGVTLLRSVGWLSRRDLLTRGVGAGPDMETPGAQCLGSHHYDFALAVDASPEELLSRSAAWRRPPTVLPGHPAAALPRLTLHDDRLQVSSLRRRDDAIELRLWNPTSDAVPVEVPGWALEATTLSQKRKAGWPGHVEPFGIETLLLTPEQAC